MQNSVPAWHGSCVSPSSTGQAVAPDLAVVCARELVRHRENLPSKEAVEKGCVFFLSSAAHIVSAECLFQEKLLMLINRKCQWVWITVSWREEKKVPKYLCLKKKNIFMQVFSKPHQCSGWDPGFITSFKFAYVLGTCSVPLVESVLLKSSNFC